MKLNVGTVDRIARAVLGLVLLFIGIGTLNGIAGNITGLIVAAIGLVLLGTALMSWCPIWAMLGVNTYKKAEPKQ